LTNDAFSYYHAQMTVKDNAMKPRYVVGQKVVIKPVNEKGLSQRDYDVNQYAGKEGKVSNYYWISPRTGQIFFIYKVLVEDGSKEIVVYEDEMEAQLA
jgi:hypothetical protein